mgnify:CR=1 FL=1|jgi:hypothetical protein
MIRKSFLYSIAPRYRTNLSCGNILLTHRISNTQKPVGVFNMAKDIEFFSTHTSESFRDGTVLINWKV